MFSGGVDWGRSCVQGPVPQTHISQCPSGDNDLWADVFSRAVTTGLQLPGKTPGTGFVTEQREAPPTAHSRSWSSSSRDKIAVGSVPDMFQTVNNMYNWWIHMTFSIPPVRQLIKEILLLFCLISSGILVPEILLGKGKSRKLKGYWTAL